MVRRHPSVECSGTSSINKQLSQNIHYKYNSVYNTCPIPSIYPCPSSHHFVSGQHHNSHSIGVRFGELRGSQNDVPEAFKAEFCGIKTCKDKKGKKELENITSKELAREI